jgi:hypothetical protein
MAKATKKQVVSAAARKHHVPPWLLWGVFGAESTYGTNGTNYFGLIEPEYKMSNGNVRRPQNTANLPESADIAAELLWSLKQEHGSWAGAVAQYAPYDISHPKELSHGGRSEGRQFVDLKTPLGTVPTPGPDFDFTNPLGPLSPVNPLEGIPNIQNPFGAAGADLGSNPLAGVEALARSVNNISAFFVGFGELVLTPDGWVRTGKLVGGSILIFWGLRVVVRVSTGTDPVKAGKKVAETAALIATVK